MRKLIDLTDKRFGRLVALEYKGLGYGSKKEGKWECLCDCGNKVLVAGIKLRTGRTRSCGCLVADTSREIGKMRKTHGQSSTRLYDIWRGMIKRCTRALNSNFVYYGGRGISVCLEWRQFENFFEWNKSLGDMGYKKGLSLDRINNDEDYSPANCRWATATLQGRNRSSNVMVTINGKTKCVAEWAELFRINRYLVYSRLRNGWKPDEKLFIHPNSYEVKNRNKVQ